MAPEPSLVDLETLQIARTFLLSKPSSLLVVKANEGVMSISKDGSDPRSGEKKEGRSRPKTKSWFGGSDERIGMTEEREKESEIKERRLVRGPMRGRTSLIVIVVGVLNQLESKAGIRGVDILSELLEGSSEFLAHHVEHQAHLGRGLGEVRRE